MFLFTEHRKRNNDKRLQNTAFQDIIGFDISLVKLYYYVWSPLQP